MIYLREYINEIENYTEQNMLDQIIAHSSHILKIYPNLIPALRFLGQAYLEEKIYVEANTCFQKLLSYIPDDFVSHVGISAIKEEDRDLDAAIFHMEIAYDTQPSNVIVQEELKRLIFKRDGEKPQKINLSRGALIRMYIKGDLFQQALNEIESALASSPDRIDLQVLQAMVYAQSNSKVQAAEVCNQILNKFPFCLVPNQILYEIYLENGLSDQASEVQGRLITLDPYYKYVPSIALKVEDIPDSKVELEKLVYTSAFTSSNEEFWLPPDNIATSIPSAAFSTTIEGQPEGNININNDSPNLIPDFMVNAGWEKSENSSNETPELIDNVSETPVEEPAIRSDVPDWLKNFQVSEEFNDPKTNQSSEIANPLVIINDTEQNDAVILNIDVSPVENLSTISEVEMTTDNPQSPPSKDDSSDWMSQFFDEANKSTSEPEEDKSLPDWLKTFGQEETPAETNAEDEVPDWLKNLDSQIVQNEPSREEAELDLTSLSEDLVSAEASNTDNSPFSLEEIVAEEITQQESQEITPVDITPENDDFLSSLEDLSKDNQIEDISSSAIVTETPEIDSLEPESPENEIPDWVKSVLSEPDEVISEAQPVFESPVEEKLEQFDIPVEAAAPMIQPEESMETSEGAISQSAGDELLEWLRGINPNQPEDVTSEKVESEIYPDVASTPEIVDESLNRLEEISNAIPEAQQEPQAIPAEPEPMDSLQTNEEITQSENILQGLESNEIPENVEPLEMLETGVIESESLLLEKFHSLIATSNYSDATSLFGELNLAGFDGDKLLGIISASKDEKIDDVDYLQFLGDSLASFDHFDEAMDIYTKAENILMNK